MPNRASKAGHIPIRSCVICKTKDNQGNLIRFAFIKNEIVFDLKRRIAARGYYVCDNNECLQKLDKWLNKRKKKSRK